MFNFCWHKWGMWGKAIESYTGSLHQVRKCEKCGAFDRRVAVSMSHAQLQAAEVNRSIGEENDN